MKRDSLAHGSGGGKVFAGDHHRTRLAVIAALSEVRAAAVEPSGFLQFAAGVAHELNNPLMAVAGWAELAQRRGAPEPALERVLEATAAAAAAVARLQQLVDSSREPEARR